VEVVQDRGSVTGPWLAEHLGLPGASTTARSAER
jgi:hypothetical protein